MYMDCVRGESRRRAGTQKRRQRLVTSSPTIGRWSLRGDGVGFDLVVEGLATDAEAAGGLKFVAVGLAENFDDLVALHRFHQGQVLVVQLGDFGVHDREVLNEAMERNKIV